LKVQTTRFGTLSIDEKEIITFPEGLVGFSSRKRYFIYNNEQKMPFFWLHSVEDPNLAFVICDPLLFFADYKVPVRKEELKVLDLEDTSRLITCVIISISRSPFRMTANLQGPLVINTANRMGKQVVLVEGSYNTRHALVLKRESFEKPNGVFVPKGMSAELALGCSLVLC
jgi:flagellar assembly factor FliW